MIELAWLGCGIGLALVVGGVVATICPRATGAGTIAAGVTLVLWALL